MPPRIINLNPNFTGQAPQVQDPRSILARLLLQRGSRLGNTSGAGIRSAGESIIGALLQKSVFEDQQAKQKLLNDALAKFGTSLGQTTPQTETTRNVLPESISANFGAGDPTRFVEGGTPIRPRSDLDLLGGVSAPSPQPERQQQFSGITEESFGAGAIQPTDFAADPRFTTRTTGPSPQQAALQNLIKANPQLGLQFALQFRQEEIAKTKVEGERQFKTSERLGGQEFKSRLQRDRSLKPFTRIGKLKTDLKNGIITTKEFATEVAGDPEVISANNLTDDGFLIERMPDGTIRKTSILAVTEAGNNKLATGQTKIYADGTVQMALKNGAIQVRTPDNRILTGKAAIEAVKKANKSEIDLARSKSGAKTSASLSATRADKAFESISKMKNTTALIDRAIQALDGGANTGQIASRLPTIRSASIRLQQIQGEMGLDVIRQTTFGSLSEAELNFALNTSMPLNLPEAELRKWLVAKKQAIEKLSDYLQSVAIYLADGENTVADWLKIQKVLQSQSRPDASQGNKTDTEFIFNPITGKIGPK